jgi:hypothetical protein
MNPNAILSIRRILSSGGRREKEEVIDGQYFDPAETSPPGICRKSVGSHERTG